MHTKQERKNGFLIAIIYNIEHNNDERAWS